MNRQTVLKRLQEELNLLRGTSTELIDGPDGERSTLLVNKVRTDWLIQFYRERGPRRGYRLNIGIPTQRKVFVLRNDGEFRWPDAARALWKAVKQLWDEKNPVAIQITSNEDYFRLIPMADLLRIVEKNNPTTRSSEIWQASIPFETSGTNSFDYVLVTDDEESWDDLRNELMGQIEEDRNARENRETGND